MCFYSMVFIVQMNKYFNVKNGEINEITAGTGNGI